MKRMQHMRQIDAKTLTQMRMHDHPNSCDIWQSTANQSTPAK